MKPHGDAEPEFVATRPGGVVGGKNLTQDDDADHVVIVFSAALWLGESTDSGAFKARAMSLIAHELAHPLFARLRNASGVAEGVVYPSQMPGEIARSLGRILMDEYRADWLSDVIVRGAASKVTDGRREPATQWHLSGAAHLEGFRALLDHAYERVPGLVNEYRTRRLDLQTMWVEIAKLTEHVLTMFVHVRAAADGSEQDIPILDAASMTDRPFVRLYLRDTLPPLLRALRSGALVPTLEEWRALELDVTSAAEVAAREIWRRAGLTFVEPKERGEYRINVSGPLR